jgi:hypothetical protein
MLSDDAIETLDIENIRNKLGEKFAASNPLEKLRVFLQFQKVRVSS